jgi:hypothetical protein
MEAALTLVKMAVAEKFEKVGGYILQVVIRRHYLGFCLNVLGAEINRNRKFSGDGRRYE